MKLLFDANLSPDLTRRLGDVYPSSAHVLFIGLGPSPADDKIWAFAALNEFVIVSKDTDFYRLSTIKGAPPKVVWLRIGNGPTSLAEATLRRAVQQIDDFLADPVAALFILGRTR